MSHGMKQKIMVISVLMRRPEVIFLDEPTVGLDARSAKILKMLLEKYKGEGSTIFMTTHVLEIAEKDVRPYRHNQQGEAYFRGHDG